MVRISFLLAAGAALATAALVTPGQARDRGGEVAAGVVGGLAAGAIAADVAGRRGPRYEVDDEGECRVVVRRSIDEYGRTRTRREEICD